MTSDLLRVLKPLKRVVNNEFYGLTNDEKHTETIIKVRRRN